MARTEKKLGEDRPLAIFRFMYCSLGKYPELLYYRILTRTLDSLKQLGIIAPTPPISRVSSPAAELFVPQSDREKRKDKRRRELLRELAELDGRKIKEERDEDGPRRKKAKQTGFIDLTEDSEDGHAQSLAG